MVATDCSSRSIFASMGEKDAVDKWAAWVLHRRDGDDLQQHAKALERLLPIRERVLDNARLESGDIVLDVGAGDGLPFLRRLLLDPPPEPAARPVGL
jgi:hypothetical protein